MTLFSLRGVVPSIPESFEKNYFWPVGFCHFRPQLAQAMVPYRRNGIFRGQNFQIFKNLRNDRYDVPNEKCQWWRRVFMPLSWSRAVQKYVFAIFNGQTLRRTISCSRSFLTWVGSYLELKLSIHMWVGGFSALCIGRSCIFYLRVVKVEVIGQMLNWPMTSTLTTPR